MSSIDVVRRHYEASERGDLEGMLADFAPDVAWTEAAGFLTGGVYVGRLQIIENVFGPTEQTWDRFAVSVDQLIEEGETVVMIGGYTGVHRVSGKALDIRTVHIWTVRGEQIVAFEQICDSHTAQLAAQP